MSSFEVTKEANKNNNLFLILKLTFMVVAMPMGILGALVMAFVKLRSYFGK
jgi:hypothetical protein